MYAHATLGLAIPRQHTSAQTSHHAAASPARGPAVVLTQYGVRWTGWHVRQDIMWFGLPYCTYGTHDVHGTVYG